MYYTDIHITMLTLNVFLFLITICVVKCEVDLKTLCNNDYRDQNNNKIDVSEYCSNKMCIEKCCGPEEIIHINNICMRKTTIFEMVKKSKRFPFPDAESRFKALNVISSVDLNKTSKKFVFIQNHRNFNNCTAEHTDAANYDISEDGSIRWEENDSKKWKQIKKLQYCIDYKVVIINNKPDIKIIISEITEPPQEEGQIEVVEIVVMLVSSVFMMLVLVVYCMLPYLRNLSGLVLMAYTFSLLFAFLAKLVQTFIKRNPPEGFCKRFSPVVYFGFMSSMCWLSVISFDVWWALRSMRKCYSTHGSLVKFMWYCLFAWGTSLLITAIVTTLDNMPYLDIAVEPRFKDCLMSGISFDYYYKIPVAILIFFNIALFIMTAYNIWMVKHNVNNCQDSRNSKQQNKLSTFIKLSVMMGVSWCLELLPGVEVLWVYITVNLYNLLTGVAIFYWFVCKKTIFMQLSKKYNIQNRFTRKWESELSRSKTGATRSTGLASSVVKNRSKDQNPEMDLLKNCPKDENTSV